LFVKQSLSDLVSSVVFISSLFYSKSTMQAINMFRLPISERVRCAAAGCSSDNDGPQSARLIGECSDDAQFNTLIGYCHGLSTAMEIIQLATGA
jgi:hypothetical protein